MKSAPIKSSTQEHLEIVDIRDDVVILKDNSAAIVIQTAAVNFQLLSVDEQDSIIYSYAGLLNSLNFTTQIVIRSKKIDLSAYIQLITQAEAHQANPDIKRQIYEYLQFIQGIVKQNNVLEKKFYVIIPFNPLELGVKGAALGNIQRDSNHMQTYIETVKTNLYPKRDHLFQQFGRLGIKTLQLTTQELIELYFDIYNPSEVGLQKITEAAGSYTTPIVTPAVSAPIEELPTQPAAITQNPTIPAQPIVDQPQPAIQNIPPVQPQTTQINQAPTEPTQTIYSPIANQSTFNLAPQQVPTSNTAVSQTPPTSSSNETIDPDILKALDALKSPTS